MTKKRTNPSELAPVPWERIEPLYRAGIQSVNAIGKQFGVSHTAIQKHAKKHGWVRNLKPAILEKADRLVAEQAVATQVANSTADRKIVDAAGEQLAFVRLGHRTDIAKLRALVGALMRKAEAAIGDPEIFGRAWDMLAGADTEVDMAVLRDMADLVASLPAQTKVLKDLADAMHRVIGMEREAYGLDTNAGTDGLPVVHIKDFTGRGDPDSPFASLNSSGGA
jgi:prophage DNA circulation protein